MSTKKTNTKFFLGLAVAFVLPLSFYMIAKVLSKDKIHLPARYGIERVDSITENGKASFDTIYHQVADLQLTNQLGENVSLNKDLSGKILVVNFFFVSCPTVCPKLTGNIGMLQKAFRFNPKVENGLDKSVHFVSVSVDPVQDTFPALRSYSERFHANHDHWWFLTGDKQSIYNYARNELKLSVGPGDGGADDFMHSQKLVLIDAKRNIRGYYDGLDTVEIKRCADDIVLLTMEKDKSRKK